MFKGSNTGLALLLLRVVVGVVFVMHGLGKLVGAPFVGPGMAGWIGYVTQLGFPVPTAVAWFGALLESLGGVALILGAGTTLVGMLLAIEMAIGIVKVHLVHGFDVFRFGEPLARGYEYSLVLAVACAAIAVGGPGMLAVQIKPKT